MFLKTFFSSCEYTSSGGGWHAPNLTEEAFQIAAVGKFRNLMTFPI